MNTDPDKEKYLEGHITVEATMNASLSIRTHLSVRHLLAAAYFSRCVADIEREYKGSPIGPFFAQISSFSSAAVLLSVASLEAYVNELFVDHEKNFPDIRADVMKKIWESFEQKSLLEKYDFALILRKGQMDKGCRPYQDVDVLVKLRNALTHFKPEWDDEQDAHAKISAQLQGKFDPTPFMGSAEPLFPKRWASHGCTKWAVESCLAFVNDFQKCADLDHRFEPYKDRLDPG